MDVEIWCFYPAEKRAQVGSFVDDLRRQSERRGWKFFLKPTVKYSAPTGRTVHLVEPRDAVALYKQAHRARVATLGLHPAEVCTHPLREFAISTRKVISIARYVQYKAYSIPLHDWNANPAAWIVAFERWNAVVECEGEHDPRCLPFHVFLASGDEEGLSDKGARDAFNRRWGAGQYRNDAQDLKWSVDKSYHGTEELHVAGRTLQRGFHWNVEPQRPPGKKRIHTPMQEWEIRDYINVGPDADIRGRHPFARVTQTSK